MFRSLDNSLLRRVLIQTYWGLYVYEYLQEWKQGGIDKVEGVESIDQVHLEPHEYQAEEEVEPQGAEDPGDGVEDQLPGDGEVDHNNSLTELTKRDDTYLYPFNPSKVSPLQNVTLELFILN